MTRDARRTSALLVLSLAMGAYGCTIARIPPEPALRVLDRERPLPVVVLAGKGTPVRVFAVGPGGEPGGLLGTTPVEIDTVAVRKEVWKYGAEPPPLARVPPPELVRSEPQPRHPGTPSPVTTRSQGEPLRWSVLVELEPGEALTRLDFELAPDALAQAFSRGRIDLHITAAAAPR